MSGLDMILAELRACGQRVEARALEYAEARQHTRDTFEAEADKLDAAFVRAMGGAA